MNDFIYRDQAIEAISELPVKVDDFGYTWMIAGDVLKQIDDIPSAKPEQKKGEWIYDGKRGRFPACKCSICGYYENADWAILQGANFCSHCGADMRGE